MDGLDDNAVKPLTAVFEKISKLNAVQENGIWARFLKNQFAPVFVGKKSFDFVIGNPSWVNWQSLSDSYRAKTLKLWENYGLFSLSGQAARLGGGKKDLAMLFTYACLDEYVKDGGRLGFIITQTLFQTKGAGDGFRRFQLGASLPNMVRRRKVNGVDSESSVRMVMRIGHQSCNSKLITRNKIRADLSIAVMNKTKFLINYTQFRA